MKQCPDCKSKVYPATHSRKRIIIDIELKPSVKEHEISSHWCPKCKEVKEEVVTDALPGFTIGNNILVYTAILHYLHGMSLSKILNYLMINKIKITSGCLVNGWHKLAQILKPNYEEIKQEIKYAESVYADETSWRQKGKLFWLWGFFSSRSALYIIRNTRSKKPILEILGKDFSGIIISDFWKPYISITSRLKQWCLAHYLREFKKVDDYRKYHPPSYLKFRKVVKRLFADAFKFSKLATNELEKQKAQTRFLNRLDKIISIKSKDPITERLKGRLRLFRNGLFTFITENVNPTNNYSEQMLRFAVILRKIQFHTMSHTGSETLSILFSIFKTMELRELSPYHETISILKLYSLDKSNLAA